MPGEARQAPKASSERDAVVIPLPKPNPDPTPLPRPKPKPLPIANLCSSERCSLHQANPATGTPKPHRRLAGTPIKDAHRRAGDGKLPAPGRAPEFGTEASPIAA